MTANLGKVPPDKASDGLSRGSCGRFMPFRVLRGTANPFRVLSSVPHDSIPLGRRLTERRWFQAAEGSKRVANPLFHATRARRDVSPEVGPLERLNVGQARSPFYLKFALFFRKRVFAKLERNHRSHAGSRLVERRSRWRNPYESNPVRRNGCPL